MVRLLFADELHLAAHLVRRFTILPAFAHDFDMIVVDDGEKAVDYILGQSAYADRRRFPVPGLILLDLKLPRRSGFKVLEAVRATEATRRVPVVVLTSSNQENDIRKAYDAGANAYLVKPIGEGALVTVVRSLDAFWIRLNKAPCR